MSKSYIVWNKAKNEGVIFVSDDGDVAPVFGSAEEDANHAAYGDSYCDGSSLANSFVEAYEDDARSIQIVDTASLLAL